MEPFLGKGHPEPLPPSARRARLPGKRSGSGGRSSQGARRACLRQEQSSGRGIGETMSSVRYYYQLIIISSNYEPNHRGAETQRRLKGNYWQSTGFVILAGCRQPQGRAFVPLGSRLHSWPPPVGRAVRAGAPSSGRAGLPGKRSGRGGERPGRA